MKFVLYSEKTVAQCLTAINARLQVKGARAVDGWVDKKGLFTMGVTTPVIGKLERTTYLRAQIERANGVTVIRGNIPSGASKQGIIAISVALAVLTIFLISTGSALLALIMLPFAAYMIIPLRGDYLNSDVLYNEIVRTLKAKTKPPKPNKPTRPSSTGRTPPPRTPTTV